MHDVLLSTGPERVQETASFARLTDGSVLFTGIQQNIRWRVASCP